MDKVEETHDDKATDAVAPRPPASRNWALDFATILMDFIFFALAYMHIQGAPFTKVEESFNLHAIHDVLMYGVNSTALQNVNSSLFSIHRL
jgi:hypothetical protein